jgi:hypothetical protein
MHHDPLWNSIPHLNIYPSNCVIKLHNKLQYQQPCVVILTFAIGNFALDMYCSLEHGVPPGFSSPVASSGWGEGCGGGKDNIQNIRKRKKKEKQFPSGLFIISEFRV